MLWSLITENEAAGVPPKLTEVALEKPLPLILTTVPAGPEAGVKEDTTGTAIKLKPSLLPVPAAVLTLTLPLDPAARVAVMVVAFNTVKDAAGVPPKLTAVAPVKSLPVMVMLAPLPAETGEKEVMEGAGIKVKPARLPVPA